MNPPLLPFLALSGKIGPLLGGSQCHVAVVLKRMPGTVFVFDAVDPCSEEILCGHVHGLLIGRRSGVRIHLGIEYDFPVVIIRLAQDRRFSLLEISCRCLDQCVQLPVVQAEECTRESFIQFRRLPALPDGFQDLDLLIHLAVFPCCLDGLWDHLVDLLELLPEFLRVLLAVLFQSLQLQRLPHLPLETFVCLPVGVPLHVLHHGGDQFFLDPLESLADIIIIARYWHRL